MKQENFSFSHPLIFLTVMGLFSFIGYHVEEMLGIHAVIIFTLWASLTLYVFVQIHKKQLAYNHPATFFAIFTTFTFTGYYIEKVLNAETYILFICWIILAHMTVAWFKRHLQMDKRVFYLLSLQFLTIAFIMPILLKYINIDLLGLCTAAGEVPIAQYTSAQISHAVLNSIEKITLIGSLIVSIYALRIARRKAHSARPCIE